MDDESIIGKTVSHVKQTLSEGTGHGWFHVERVWEYAKRIGKEEGADLFIVELTALLHDIADWKFHEGDEDAGSREARKWLESLDVDEDVVDEVCNIIDGVSYKGANVDDSMETLEG